ncbi:tetratricopeptide repeat protein [Opitutus terrae]|uniref:Tetratricopeptide domain protein n=1 Tax=Opitutus terrae (strain DSM 11246 / JCM 15787 / PB90-1) TaxID=452637 RepID=B1ZMK4_OPITP|nr:tetratricopeptide repeat protein [Opitutus terrae]ACB74349.1 Tetratricopeptide domain protein [Opitutus terrae PB90-1]
MKATRSLFFFVALGGLGFSVRLLAGDDALGDQLGTIQFEVSGSPEARDHVVRGTQLLHHMMYPEADRAFARAIAADPHCALAYWGRAMTLLHPLWPDAPTEAELRQGAEFIDRGLACPPATVREQDYLRTLAAYFGHDASAGHVPRLQALDVASGQLADRYPDDLDALAFSALFHLAPTRFQSKDKSHRVQLEAAAQLQRVLAKLPNHPGAQHYKIHAYDFPLLADRALEVCDTYGSVAPDVPHALHMPTHIYTRRGLWEKSIEFNRRSAEAARKLSQSAGALNAHETHALDYLVYAHLQRGQYAEAEKIRRYLATLTGPFSPVQLTATAFAFAAIPARCTLERQRWDEAAKLPLRQPAAFPWGRQYLQCDSIVRYARAIGAARSGQLDAARSEVAELQRVRQQLAASVGAAYWRSQAETQLLAAQAWVQWAEGKRDDAIASMRRAAEIEASTDKEAVTPGEVVPAGDLLGDLLLETGRSTEALAAFEAVLEASPNRFNSLYGAGLAAERSGNTVKAAKYYQQLLAVAVDADAGNARVNHARTVLSGSAVVTNDPR